MTIACECDTLPSDIIILHSKNDKRNGEMKNARTIFGKLEKVLSSKDNSFIEELKSNMERYNVSNELVSNIVDRRASYRDEKISHIFLLFLELYKMTGDEEVNPSLLHLYNSEIKSKFLNKYPKDTQLTYLRIFENSYKLEKEYGKDLFAFDIKQLEKLMYELSPLTNTASNVNGRIVTSYVDYCINDLGVDVTNELKDKSTDYFSKFVDSDNNLYLTESEIEEIEDMCVNYQDAVIIRLLFEGVQGRELSEIRNMKKSDINFNEGYILLDDRKEPFKVSDRALHLLGNAMNQSIYLKNNGEMEGKEHVGLDTNLVDNDYVIRASVTKTDTNNKPVNKMVLYRRVQTIADTLGYNFLTTKNIVRSGLIHYAKKIYDSKKSLEKEDYLNICHRYDIKNWYPVKKYCNEDVIEELYYTEESFNVL